MTFELVQVLKKNSPNQVFLHRGKSWLQNISLKGRESIFSCVQFFLVLVLSLCTLISIVGLDLDLGSLQVIIFNTFEEVFWSESHFQIPQNVYYIFNAVSLNYAFQQSFWFLQLSILDKFPVPYQSSIKALAEQQVEQDLRTFSVLKVLYQKIIKRYDNAYSIVHVNYYVVLGSQKEPFRIEFFCRCIAFFLFYVNCCVYSNLLLHSIWNFWSHRVNQFIIDL